MPTKGAAPRRTTETLVIDGRTLVLSNRDKVLWPDDGYTKGELVAYYRSVVPWIVPHLRDRPLTLERYPDGIDGQSFFEKHAPCGLPSWIPTVGVPSDSGRRDRIDFIVCNDEPALVYVANLAAVVLHVWTSRVNSLDVPDFVFFDLDPFEGCTLATLAKVALGLRAALAEIGLGPLVKSSGGSGRRCHRFRECLNWRRGRCTGGSPISPRSNGCPRDVRAGRSTSITSKLGKARRSSRPTRFGRAARPPSRCRSIGARSRRCPASAQRTRREKSRALR